MVIITTKLHTLDGTKYITFSNHRQEPAKRQQSSSCPTEPSKCNTVHGGRFSYNGGSFPQQFGNVVTVYLMRLAKANNTVIMPTALQEVSQALKVLSTQQRAVQYRLPAIWEAPYSGNGSIEITNPAGYYHSIIQEVLQNKIQRPGRDEAWLGKTKLCTFFVRHVTTYDHNNDGNISTGLLPNGWRETGTFIKGIALLPYLKDLGCTAIHLLPVFSIGAIAQKGNVGSPYSIKNPYVIENTLSEPIVGLPAAVQYKAFIEAAHRLGMKVIQEFALRTVSKDSDWIEQHPEWFYWINDSGSTSNFTPPAFNSDDLTTIEKKMNSGERNNLPQPNAEYKRLFTNSPVSVSRSKQHGFVGTSDGDTTCMVPGAFADYPPDDTQPLWSDVTYLKLYNHPSYNYVSYNTIRMYDEEMSKPEYEQHELWNTIADVIPYYVKEYAIDGALLDMSHALPVPLRDRIITSVRKLQPNFVFIEENFRIQRQSKDIGFDAVVGDSWFAALDTERFNKFVDVYQNARAEIPFFACTNSHNTPRIASRYDLREIGTMINKLLALPESIPCIVVGDEIGEKNPINTGLGFSPEEVSTYPPEQLALFSACALNWHNADTEFRKMYKSFLNFNE
ncbi:MAG: alpha-amylase [Candidatus Kapabacteria bacterium]|nr:alpha-amylase [Candidatus Kapabacteria bacterium]